MQYETVYGALVARNGQGGLLGPSQAGKARAAVAAR